MTDFTQQLAKARESLASTEFTIDYVSGMGEHITITRAAVTDHHVSIRFSPDNMRPWKLQMYGGPHSLPRGRAMYCATFEQAVIAAAKKLNELAGVKPETPAKPDMIVWVCSGACGELLDEVPCELRDNSSANRSPPHECPHGWGDAEWRRKGV